MQRIEVVYENGHRLKASRQLCGMTRTCPKCGANVKIPMPLIERSPDLLSDTAVMRILGAHDVLSNPPMEAAVPVW